MTNREIWDALEKVAALRLNIGPKLCAEEGHDWWPTPDWFEYLVCKRCNFSEQKREAA